nr:unnamed protein product [Spirometra erinaceieuropaei]
MLERVLIVCLLALNIFDVTIKIVEDVEEPNFRDILAYLSPTVVMTSLVLVLIIDEIRRSHRCLQSTVIFFFWLSLLMVSIPRLCKSSEQSSNSERLLRKCQKLSAGLFVAVLSTIFILQFLSSYVRPLSVYQEKELQKLALPSSSCPLPAKLSRSGDFDRWEARMTDYLGGVDDKSKGVAILSQLDDDVYDLARASGINSTTPIAEIFRDLRRILCGSTPTWLVRSEFRRRFQRPFESVVEFQQALRLLGRKAYPTLAAAHLEETLLEQFIDGVSDPEVRKALLRQQPSKLDDALRLAQQEEALQAACATPLRGCVGVASVRSQSGVDVSTQTPWHQCACGSCSPRQTNWRRPPISRTTGHQGRRSIQAVDVEQEDNTDAKPVNMIAAVESVINQTEAAEETKNLIRHQVTSLLMTHKPRETLTKVERDALRELKADKDIVIVPADKGRSTVVLDRTDYLQKARNLLEDRQFYVPCETNPIKTLTRQINATLLALENSGAITATDRRMVL